jgi:tetratricopeptide (TPR) repeat protein
MDNGLYFKPNTPKGGPFKSIPAAALIAGIVFAVWAGYFKMHRPSNALSSITGNSGGNENVSSEEFAEFLREKVINNPAPALPASHYAPGPAIDWKNISTLLNSRQFEQINGIFDAARNGPAITNQGIPAIGDQDELEFESSDFAVLNEYCSKFSASPWPFLFRGQFYVWYAWQARGTGWASTVTEEGWKLMKERLAQAIDDFLAAARNSPGLVYSYSAAGYAAMRLGRMRTALQLYQKALALDPAGWDALNSLFEDSKSKWYGTDDELMFEFARKIAANHPEYPYLKRLILKAHEEMAWRHADKDRNKVKEYLTRSQVWDEIINTFKGLLVLYPESKYLRKHLSQDANWAGKQAEVGDLLW